jgi:cytochrome b pre-mRNA-processing protein 3
MLFWPFGPSKTSIAAASLLDAVVAAGRRAAFFGDGRVADTLDGRFEVLTLHAGLALMRLRAEPGAEALAQMFTDRYFRALDAGLREAGVGDLTVPKRIRALAASFYGRLNAYGLALANGSGLEEAVARNVFGAADHPFASSLAKYLRKTAERQAAAPAQALQTADGWPQFEP